MTSDIENEGGGFGELTASVIIPTYNRRHSLARALRSLNELEFPRDQWEVIVVDNKSTDDTKQIVEAARSSTALNLKYVKEEHLSFTAARHTGAKAASSRLLCYIDDDVIVDKNWLASIVDVFKKDESVGMVGGRIEPIFEVNPPDWALVAQSKFNGWSLWHYADVLCEAPGACGPNLCIRKSVLDDVGGFPPDTIGVESAGKPGTVEKIYIGDGDAGLSHRVWAAGYKVMYSPDAIVYHVIPPVRMTKAWWQSRHSGEAYVHVFVDRVRSPRGLFGTLCRIVWCIEKGCKHGILLVGKSMLGRPSRDAHRFVSVAAFTQARVEFVLARNPQLANRLWEIASSGVPSNDIDKLTALLL